MELIREGTDRVATVGELTIVVHGSAAESAGIRASLTIRRGAGVVFHDRIPLWSLRRRKDVTAAFPNGEAEQVERALLDLEATLADEHARGEESKDRTPIVTEMEPWPELVDGARLLEALAEALRRFVILTPAAYTAVPLWTLAAHALEGFDVFPMLAVLSPVKRCGKSTLLSVLTRFLPRPLPTSNISVASIYRTIQECKPSLLADEADTFARDNPELRGVLNSGHSRALAFVVRMEGEGENLRPARFSTWCAKVVAAIGKLPETWEDRSIIIPMRRRAKGEAVERARRKALEPLGDLGRMAARWAADYTEDLTGMTAAIPDELDDRAADNWMPLFSVADLVGGPWPEKARKAALALSAGRDAEDDGAGARLLRNVWEVFVARKADRLPSADLVDALLEEKEWGWATWYKGKPLNQRSLANLLRSFDIRSKQVWVTGQNVRGFERADFVDSWARYGASNMLGPLEPVKDKELEAKSHPLDAPIPSGSRTGLTAEKQGVLADLADETPHEAEVMEL